MEGGREGERQIELRKIAHADNTRSQLHAFVLARLATARASARAPITTITTVSFHNFKSRN